MKRLLVLVVLVSFGSIFMPIQAYGTACTNSTLFGAFGYQEQGRYAAQGVDFRVVGNIKFDGKGKANGTFTIWYSDFTVTGGPIVLSYSVEPDCRVSWRDVTYGDGETYTGVIVSNGQKILYIETTGDPARSGEAEKIRVTSQNSQ